MRPVILMLAVPLALIVVAQVWVVDDAIVATDVVAAAMASWAAVRLGRTARTDSHESAASHLTRDEWILLGVTWAVVIATHVVAAMSAVQWAAATAWALTTLTTVLLARAESRPVLWAAMMTALLVVGSVLSTPVEEVPVLLPVISLFLLPAVAVGLLARNQRRAAAWQREAARDRERRAMAEELHDVVAHEVTGIVVLAQALAPMLARGPSATAIERIELSGQRALDHIRTMVAMLRAVGDEVDGYAPPVSSLAELRPLVDHFAATVPADVRVDMRGLDRPVPPQTARAASRILTEALTNVQRHALTASRVDVRVMADDEAVHVEVVDDGVGGGVGAGNGSGLVGMAERAALLGGVAEAKRRSDGRWRVAARLPLARARANDERSWSAPRTGDGGDHGDLS